jgi:Xaa-Pro aminopeptidase
MTTRTPVLTVLAMLVLAVPARAQLYQADFPPEEFRARWQQVFERIGKDAVAVVQGAPMTTGFVVPRQANSFYYLCGIETPGAYLLMDGRSRQVTLFLPPRNERLERSEGKVLSAQDAAEVKAMVGVDEVRPTTAMTGEWPVGPARGAAIYAEFAPAEGWAESRYELESAAAAVAADYWDARPPRHAQFLQLLRTRHPRVEVRDLTPVLDEMRIVKSPREVALIRRASQLAGLGILAAIRSTRPGVYEYQLDAAARYVFQVNGARLDGYRSITASGTENINNGHYWRNTRQLQDGDLVLMDYAPDYRYYVSDVTRMWPAGGRYLPWQRELLQFVLQYRNVILGRIRPGRTPDDILAEAREAMAPVLARTQFSKPVYAAAARKLVETGGGVLSHPVGLAVHDVGSYRRGPLRPGHVFSIDPQLWVPEEKLYIRYEDVVAITETGVENFTDFLPSELSDIEALVGKAGIVQFLPPTGEPRRP